MEELPQVKPLPRARYEGHILSAEAAAHACRTCRCGETILPTSPLADC